MTWYEDPADHIADAVPCADCGGEAIIEPDYGDWFVSCGTCPKGRPTFRDERPSEAVADWNLYQSAEPWPGGDDNGATEEPSGKPRQG